MQHGGDLGEAASRFGGSDAAWLDMSTGINPHPWPAPEELREEGWTRLPSGSDLARLIAAARALYGVPSSAVIAAAPGTQAVIQWLPCLAPRRPVAIVSPTYSEHETVWRSHGFEVHQIRSLAEAGDEPRHVVVVNPNNPDGRVTDRAEILAAACAVPAPRHLARGRRILRGCRARLQCRARMRRTADPRAALLRQSSMASPVCGSASRSRRPASPKRSRARSDSGPSPAPPSRSERPL
jgi:hypothetical protein